MGKAAYDRGSKNIRRQIADERNEIVSVTRSYVSHLESDAAARTELIRAQAEQIANLKTELERAQMFVKLRAGERDVLRDERDAACADVQTWKAKARDFERKWLKCSAILKLIGLYVGREQLDDWHNETKHDYPHLWSDVERDHMGWPIKKNGA